MGERGAKKTLEGVVVSDKMDKTVVIRVERLIKHPRTGKYIRRKAKFMAHDEKNECKINDKVQIVQTRPLSKHKNWRVLKILERAE
ncbi:MAG: 30S ribosomal protein S17 [Candidatus Methanoperedenaceae archaeon GB37]|nr:30S ribosomal protein S17 [Candidatus Methanoperedenaceae archaeon GB37]CAD7782533.1 MAG: 30S ribosomal protein S17 [Candidatus Methanoperedenaceae archaeon GB37]